MNPHAILKSAILLSAILLSVVLGVGALQL